MSMSNDAGLRARKKLATRQAISDVATELFVTRGFDAVTVAEIADAAGVAKMTVFNYFPRKEDLFFDRQEEGRALIGDALAAREKGESLVGVLERMVRGLVEAEHPLASFGGGIDRFWETVDNSAALTARAREIRDDLAVELATMLATAAGRPADDADAKLGAQMFVAAWTVGYAEGLRQWRKGQDGEAAQKVFMRLMGRGISGMAGALVGTPYV